LSDLNNDGYDDLIMGQLRRMSNGQDDMASIVILNDKNGYFKQENLINLPYSNFNETWNYVRGIIATDINNDGFKDLIFGLCRAATSNSKFPFSGTSFQVLLNQKGVKYVDSTQNYIQNDKYLEAEYDSIRKATNQNEPMSLEYIDMNLDNNKDIFMTRSWQSVNKYMPLIMENNTRNYFKAIDSNKISNNTDWVGMVASSIDINGDKLQDIISLSTMPGKDGIYSTADDVMEYIPIIANFTPVIIDSIFYFKEKQNTGTKIGNLNIKDINNKTHSFKLSGINASSFKIDSLGNIYSNDSVSFLYQNNKSLKFSVEASDNYSTTKSNITINIICQPDKPSFINTSYLICSPDSLKLELKNTQNTDSLIWYINNKQDKINQTYIYLKDPIESVYVTRITNLGCKINTDTLKIYKSQKPNTPILSRDADNNLISNSTGNTWYKDGVKISDTTQKFKPTTNGIYTATTTQNGCTSSISQGYYYLTNAVANLTNGEYFKISPNPTSGELNINYKISSSRNINISIFDINGRAVLLNKKVESGSKVNLGSISKGNYIIQAKDGSGRLIASQKLVKE
jgi:hypothetical protein